MREGRVKTKGGTPKHRCMQWSTKTRQMHDVSASKEEEEWTNGERGQGMKGEHTTFGHGGRNVHSGGAPLSFKMANWVRGNKTGGG